ncbi:TPA: hypothetical protein ONA18_004134 [Pseudomonas aeruginosa]|nr:hypothetical protein [Pseudomonas aeruginosa]
MKKYLAIALVAAAIAGCDSELPIAVDLGSNSMWGTPQLQITAKQDNVTINKVQVNRGNCRARAQDPLPFKVPFGQVLKVDTPSCMRVVEVSISTNEGDYVFSFDN